MTEKQGLFKSSIILFVAMIITKVVGAVFKIPLANILGGSGMGYFSSAYGLFWPVYSIVAAGLPVAVVRLVAENSAKGNVRNLRKIKRVSLIYFSLVGFIGSIVILAFAKVFSNSLAQNPNAYMAVIAMAPSVFFCCVMAVYRGYYEGLQNMYPTAVSQVVESLIKAIFGLGLSYGTLQYGIRSYEKSGLVFGEAATSFEQATMLTLPYAAAAATLGVTISTFAGLVAVLIRHRIYGDGIKPQHLKHSQDASTSRAIFSQLFITAIPIAIGAAFISISSLIDLATIIRGLSSAINASPHYFAKKYEFAIIDGVPLDELANFIYGSYTGLASTIIAFIPAMSTMFGKSALPSLTASWSVGNKAAIKHNIEVVLRASALFAIPAGLGLFVMAEPALMLLYPNRPSEVSIAALPLAVMSIGAIMFAIVTPVFSMLQAIGRTDLPVKLMAFCAVIKLVGNVTLIRIPSINILGASISTTISYSVITVMGIVLLLHNAGVGLRIKRIFILPTIAGIACAIGAALMMNSSFLEFHPQAKTIASIGFGAILYAIVLFITGGIRKNEIFDKINHKK
ncbi:MAG: polysaccharide biosynthesis protein [Clostridiales bacterium]|nr:polysaccharide biosynthesis protein [Clostridiales bacterium]